MAGYTAAAAHRFARTWEAADPALRKALAEAGASSAPGLAFITDGSWEDARAAAQGLAGQLTGEDEVRVAQWAGELQLLQDAARGATADQSARYARRAPEDLAADAEVHLRAGGGPLEAMSRTETQKRLLSYAPAPRPCGRGA